ncbi:diphosphomevalonate decarboxylase [Eremococcus coleocola]|uniref:diphosphomevalonate decarboxylase n=1 Tax=Eremococcus coleocola ACS-139-V-Col8 TaxID=908337 RepID=E4KRA3_9LACT|nr:diphosphomevalonate decarboxylase [Eremococcus coleocola]EFR30505.1 diphosphomevalonate decarboxylase [Eremococcus coleocola ACS-139-V-Col8]
MTADKYQARMRAHTNIALVKYWGKRNKNLFLPVTSSLSLTLDAFYTETEVLFDPSLKEDSFTLDGQVQTGQSLAKVSNFVDLFRRDFNMSLPVQITSRNHVPTAAGLASSASAFAALAAASNQALGLGLSPEEVSVYARQGSGSASRSLFGGFALWHKGQGDDSASSYAQQIDPADWDIAMLVVLVNPGPKKISSRQGMEHTMQSSPFYALWPEEVAKDLSAMEDAIKDRNIDQIGIIAEHNAMKMHATMIASNPSFTYWQAQSLLAMERVRQLRQAGYSAYFTMDAGPNVKVICPYSQVEAIRQALLDDFAEDHLVISRPGPAPYAV